MNEGHVEQDLPDNIDEFDVSIFDESELSDPAALALALEPGNPLKREIVLEAPPPARARGRTAVSSGAGPSKRRKRALACPVCVMNGQDGTMAGNPGEGCAGGHIAVDNARKTWKCLQCQRSLSINGSWITTARRHFDDDGVCVALRDKRQQGRHANQSKKRAVESDVEVPQAVFQEGAAASSLAQDAVSLSTMPTWSGSSGEPSVSDGAHSGHLECCECSQPAQLVCESCSGRAFCADCDFKVHSGPDSFQFLRSHVRTVVLPQEARERSVASASMFAHQCVAFPSSGECHASQMVRLCKTDDMLALFPNTLPTGSPGNPHPDAFEVTMSFEGRTIAVQDVLWESPRCLTVHLPSYASVVGANHPPHRTLCNITVRPTDDADPALTWRYTIEHTHLLEKISMLETLNTTLKDLAQNLHTGFSQPTVQGSGVSSSAPLASSGFTTFQTSAAGQEPYELQERALARDWLRWLQTEPASAPSGVTQLLSGRASLEAWRALADEHGYRLAALFLEEAVNISELTLTTSQDMSGEEGEENSAGALQGEGEDVPPPVGRLEQWLGVTRTLGVLAALHPDQWVADCDCTTSSSRRSSFSDDTTSAPTNSETCTSTAAINTELCQPCCHTSGAGMTIVQGSLVPERRTDTGEVGKHEGTYAIKDLDAVAIDVDEDENEWEDGLHGSSCCLFGPDSQMRQYCDRLVRSPNFDKVIIVAVAAYILLCFAKVFALDKHPGSQEILWSLLIVEMAFLVFFTLECLTKVIARGFMFGRDAYLKQPWNGLDFSVLMIAILQFAINFNTSTTNGTTGVEVLRALRILALVEDCARPLKPMCLRICRSVH